MGLLGDAFGDAKFSLYLATACALGLAALAVWNAVADPTRARLLPRDEADCALAASAEARAPDA